MFSYPLKKKLYKLIKKRITIKGLKLKKNISLKILLYCCYSVVVHIALIVQKFNINFQLESILQLKCTISVCKYLAETIVGTNHSFNDVLK